MINSSLHYSKLANRHDGVGVDHRGVVVVLHASVPVLLFHRPHKELLWYLWNDSKSFRLFLLMLLRILTFFITIYLFDSSSLCRWLTIWNSEMYYTLIVLEIFLILSVSWLFTNFDLIRYFPVKRFVCKHQANKGLIDLITFMN